VGWTELFIELKPYGDLIFVGGTLTIFFSWLVTNAIADRLKAAKEAGAEARASYRLFTTLNELKQSLEGVVSAVFNVYQSVVLLEEDLLVGRDLEAATMRRRAALDSEARGIDFAESRINANQIDAGLRFCEETLIAVGKDRSSDVEMLRAVRDAIARLKQGKDEMFQEADKIRREGGDPRIVLQGLSLLVDEFGLRLEEAVIATNRVHEAHSARISRLDRQKDMGRRAAFVLYVFGTILVVAGTALTKLVK
jgi:hypothetical protein